MRVFICFEGFYEPFDVPADLTVETLKQMVKENFLVNLRDDKHVRQHLEMIYGGAALQDSWALCDVGITSGSAIRCLIKSEQKPVILVFNAVTRETLPIMGSESLLLMSVAELKTMVSMQSNFPVSTFRLCTCMGVQLYDCNRLQDYITEVGSVLRMDTWDGWVDFLQGCLLGHKLTVKSHLSRNKSEMRFQLQVALYIAACLGHLDLADWLIEKGMHAEEPVGVHPFRQWCHPTAHRDTGKCPIHIAAERGQLLILKLFVTKNLLTLACWDPAGHNPLEIALQNGHRESVCYLVNKLCSVVSFPNMCLPMRIYLQIKRWASLGAKRAASNRCQDTSGVSKASVEDMLLVDGFSHPLMSSKSVKTVIKPNKRHKIKYLQPLPPICSLLSAAAIPSKPGAPQLMSPQSVNPGDFKEHEKILKTNMKIKEQGLLSEICEGDSKQGRGKFVLPPVTRENIQTEVFDGVSLKSSYILESFCHRCGHTPRENAEYCLSVARSLSFVLLKFMHNICS
ncbi:uncharacterized protein V6R79_007002 [Siganus canaliculatus]